MWKKNQGRKPYAMEIKVSEYSRIFTLISIIQTTMIYIIFVLQQDTRKNEMEEIIIEILHTVSLESVRNQCRLRSPLLMVIRRRLASEVCRRTARRGRAHVHKTKKTKRAKSAHAQLYKIRSTKYWRVYNTGFVRNTRYKANDTKEERKCTLRLECTCVALRCKMQVCVC